MFAATAVAAGVLAPVLPTSGLNMLLAQVPSLGAWVLLYLWFKSDAARHGCVTRTEFNGLVIAASFLALPVHFLRSRGWRRGLLATGLFYLATLGWSVAAAITAILAHTVLAG